DEIAQEPDQGSLKGLLALVVPLVPVPGAKARMVLVDEQLGAQVPGELSGPTCQQTCRRSQVRLQLRSQLVVLGRCEMGAPVPPQKRSQLPETDPLDKAARADVCRLAVVVGVLGQSLEARLQLCAKGRV